MCVKPAPRDFIESYIGGSDYWANNIRKEYKATNPDHIAFCNTFKKMIQDLMVYVKEFHTTGVAWNPRGVDISEFTGEIAKPTASSSSSSTTG